MIEKLQPFIHTPLHEEREVAQFYVELYDRAGNTIGEYEQDEDDMLQRVQFFIDDAPQQMIAAEEATRIAKQVVAALDTRALKLDALISYDTHYLAIFEETDERFQLSLPNTGAHISINGDGQLLGASFFHEPYTVKYPEQMISQEEANERLQTLPLMKRAIDLEHETYTYMRDHYVLGVHVDGTIYNIQDDGGLTIQYVPVTASATHESVEQLMLQEIGQHISVAQDTSIEGVKHYYIVQQHEDEAYTLDLSSFDDVDDDVLDFDMEGDRLVELQHSGIDLPEGVLIARAEQLVQALVGDEAVHYVREQTDGMAELLAASPFYAQMEPPEEVTYRFLYTVDDVLLHDKPIEISLHRSTGVAIEVVHHVVPYDVIRNLQKPAINLEKANAIARNVATMQRAFMRTSIEENLYDLAYLIDYPNSPTGGAINRIDAHTGAITYIDGDEEQF